MVEIWPPVYVDAAPTIRIRQVLRGKSKATSILSLVCPDYQPLVILPPSDLLPTAPVKRAASFSFLFLSFCYRALICAEHELLLL